MAEENKKQEAENRQQEADSSKQVVQPQPTVQTQSTGSSEQAAVSSKQGMSSGAKWGIGIGVCCCCLLILIIIFFVLGFAGCSFIRGFGGYNWPATPPLDQGTEIPIPSFSNTPTPSK